MSDHPASIDEPVRIPVIFADVEEVFEFTNTWLSVDDFVRELGFDADMGDDVLLKVFHSTGEPTWWSSNMAFDVVQYNVTKIKIYVKQAIPAFKPSGASG